MLYINEPYLINKCCNYIKYSIDNYNIYFNTHSEINIQSRCSNIKHNPGADSQVGQLVADTKVVQKLLSFLKRMWLAIWFLQGDWQSQPD